MSVEKRVTDTILQTPFDVRVGGETYQVAPPSCAVLILVSEMISTMQFKMDKEAVLNSVLKYAKDCRVIGDIVALIILGIDGCIEKKKIVRKHYWGLKKEVIEIEINHQDILSRKLLKLSPNELGNLLANLLTTLEVSDFFGLTASLSDLNLLLPEAGTTTETFGR